MDTDAFSAVAETLKAKIRIERRDRSTVTATIGDLDVISLLMTNKYGLIVGMECGTPSAGEGKAMIAGQEIPKYQAVLILSYAKAAAIEYALSANLTPR